MPLPARPRLLRYRDFKCLNAGETLYNRPAFRALIPWYRRSSVTGVARGAILAGALALGLAAPGTAQADTLNEGDKAPDFTLPDQTGKQVKLSDFLGKKNVVLAFYVLAFTGG